MIEIKVTGESAKEALLDLKQLTQGLVGGCSCQDTTEPREDVKEVNGSAARNATPSEIKEKQSKEEKKDLDKSKSVTEANKSNKRGSNGNATGKDNKTESDTEGDTQDSEEEKTYTLVEVRAKAMELQRAGKKDFLKQVIEACEASKLSEIPEDKFSYAMACFEAGEVLDDEEVPF